MPVFKPVTAPMIPRPTPHLNTADAIRRNLTTEAQRPQSRRGERTQGRGQRSESQTPDRAGDAEGRWNTSARRDAETQAIGRQTRPTPSRTQRLCASAREPSSTGRHANKKAQPASHEGTKPRRNSDSNTPFPFCGFVALWEIDSVEFTKTGCKKYDHMIGLCRRDIRQTVR